MHSSTRYARTADSGAWLHAGKGGFVGAILDSIEDGHDRSVLAWPSRPDNGFVAAAIAMREARATGRLAHATLALWPWRSGATSAARSILVHPQDIARVAGLAATQVRGGASWVDPRLAHTALYIVELRLNDLLRSDSAGAKGPTVRNPTLLETTAVFALRESASSGAYEADAGQILSRVRQYTHIDNSGTHIAAVGDPRVTPFAVMGLPAAGEHEIRRLLGFSRFRGHGLDAIVIDLTHTARSAMAPNWERFLLKLLSAIDGADLPRRPPVVVLSEDVFALGKASGVLRRHAKKVKSLRRYPIRRGALLMSPGILESPDRTADSTPLARVAFDVDIKDATLRPLRKKLTALAQRLREVGNGEAAQAVGSGLRALHRFASLPIGVSEAQKNASIIYPGDDRDDIDARSRFFPTAALQAMADGERIAPDFAAEIRDALDEIRGRVASWNAATPVSMKLEQLLRDASWNARDVLIVMPDVYTADLYLVSDSCVACRCTVIDVSQFAQHVGYARRIAVVGPDLKMVRLLMTMHAAPERVLLLSDASGTSLIAAELVPLMSVPEFARFADRARLLSRALKAGGGLETADHAEADIRYSGSKREGVLDFTKTDDDYSGETVHFGVERGDEIAYRPGSEVLVFTPDEVRPFARRPARDVRVGDHILVLRKDVRDRLSAALLQARKSVVQLRQYHEMVARVRESLPGETLRAKARYILAAMRLADSSVGDHEVPNIARWLSVQPSEAQQQPRAARDAKRFALFMQATGIDKTLGDAFWEFAILPSRSYSSREGYVFNRRIVQFVLDPEGVAAGGGFQKFDGLWQAIVDSVDVVTRKEAGHG